MAKISEEDIEHIAQLARIKISPEEKQKFIGELSAILDYVAELEQSPTGGIEVIQQISGLENISRLDGVEESLPVEKVLQNAPDKENKYIKVKQVLE